MSYENYTPVSHPLQNPKENRNVQGLLHPIRRPSVPIHILHDKEPDETLQVISSKRRNSCIKIERLETLKRFTAEEEGIHRDIVENLKKVKDDIDEKIKIDQIKVEELKGKMELKVKNLYHEGLKKCDKGSCCDKSRNDSIKSDIF